MGHYRLEVRYHLLNARPALILGFKQTPGVHQNRAVALQHPTYHKFCNKHARSLLAVKLSQDVRPNPLCKTGLKIQYTDAKNAAPTKKGRPKATLFNGDALYTENVIANFAINKGMSEKDVTSWRTQLAVAEKEGRFGFASFPVLTSAHLES